MLCRLCGCSAADHLVGGKCTHKCIPQYSDETRIVDPLTGGEKGQKTQRFSLIPSGFLWALATHYGVGAKKYEDRNWEKGYKWSLSEDAYSRHFNQWKSGKTHDDETGTHHLICAIWHLIALWWFDTNQKGTDDIRGK